MFRNLLAQARWIKRLVEALRPFATLYEPWMDDESDDLVVPFRLRIGTVKAARKLVGDGKGDKQPAA